MQLRAAHGADTSGAIIADLVRRHVVRRDIYVGPATRVELDTVVVWRGPAQLAGEVRGSDGRIIAGASVSVLRAEAVATTNSDGRFFLTGLPAGSQTLSVRALGFVPARITVHLMTGTARNHTQVSLTSLKAYLDTIRVTATRVYTSDVNGFESRKRAGQGHYIDRDQIERRHAVLPSDLLRMLPRVEVASSGTGWFGKVVAFRNPFGRGYCRPDLWLDGVLFKSGDMEIDEIVNPDHVEAIEVYTKPGLAPVQFTNNMSGCGSIVVWLRKQPVVQKGKTR